MTTCDFSGVHNLNNLPPAQYVVTATYLGDFGPDFGPDFQTIPTQTFINDVNCALVIVGPVGPDQTIGWLEPGRPRRRIPIEQFREILRAQGNPWADELADVVEKAPKRTKKYKKILDEIIEEIPELAIAAVDWDHVISAIRASAEATRATLALKHLQAALDLLKSEWDDEEAIILACL